MQQIIGQESLKKSIGELKKLPQFTILLGAKGGGKTLIGEYLAEVNNYRYMKVGNKIADIRRLIEDSIAIGEPTVYSIIDGDNMTLQASNALLKLSEEPPNNLYLVLELTDLQNTLPTIMSRGKIMQIDNYSYLELKEYYQSLGVEVAREKELLNCASTPGQIREFIASDFDNMYNYAKKVYDNILRVTTGNSFKIRNEFAFKHEENKYSPNLFFSIFTEVIIEEMRNGCVDDINNQMIKFTNEARIQMRKKGANKSLIFDLWVLNIRTLR